MPKTISEAEREENWKDEIISASHDYIRHALNLPNDAPRRFDYYAMKVEELRQALIDIRDGKDNPCHIVNMALKGKDKMKSIEDRIKQILSEHLGVKEGFIQPHHNIKDDLGADSLDYVEIVMYLEDEFDMEIPDEEAEKFDTVQSVIDYVHTNT